MSDFKWRHFQGDIILGCVRWYCKYGISYRDLEEIVEERGIVVDYSTLYCWVIQYALKLEKRLRWYWKPGLGYSWRVDETYAKVRVTFIELLISEDIQLIFIFHRQVTSVLPSFSFQKLLGDLKNGKYQTLLIQTKPQPML